MLSLLPSSGRHLLPLGLKSAPVMFQSFLSSSPSQAFLPAPRQAAPLSKLSFRVIFLSSPSSFLPSWTFHCEQVFSLQRPPCPKSYDCALSSFKKQPSLLSEICHMAAGDLARLSFLLSELTFCGQCQMQRQVPYGDCHAAGRRSSEPSGAEGRGLNPAEATCCRLLWPSSQSPLW